MRFILLNYILKELVLLTTLLYCCAAVNNRMSLGIPVSNGVLIWLPNGHICYLKINEWSFLGKSLPNQPNKGTSLINMAFVATSFEASLWYTNFIYPLHSKWYERGTWLWTWTVDTLICTACNESWPVQDLQSPPLKYGAQRTLSRCPYILLTFRGKTVFASHILNM